MPTGRRHRGASGGIPATPALDRGRALGPATEPHRVNQVYCPSISFPSISSLDFPSISRIVGHEGAEPAAGLISFNAPLSRARRGAEVGEVLAFGGVEGALEVAGIKVVGE